MSALARSGANGMTEAMPPKGAEKGLLFLVSLEEAVATKILKCMSPEEVRALRSAADRLREVDPTALTAVHVEFAQHMERGVPTSLRGSSAYLRRLVGQALGEGKAAELWTEVKVGAGAVQQLAELDIPTIVGIIDREHPQTLAVILYHKFPFRAPGMKVIINIIAPCIFKCVIYGFFTHQINGFALPYG